MSDDILKVYKSKKDYFVKCAEEIVGNRPDAEDAVHNAFLHAMHMNGGYRPGVMQKLVSETSRRLVERREKRAVPAGSTSDLANDVSDALDEE